MYTKTIIYIIRYLIFLKIIFNRELMDNKYKYLNLDKRYFGFISKCLRFHGLGL